MYGVIVDGYSSGAELVSEFKKLNIICLHIQSKPLVPDVYQKTFKLESYLKNFIFDENLEDTLNQVKSFNPLFCIPGSEPGVELADFIGNKLNLPRSNPFLTSKYRRNKFLMQEQLRKHGLSNIKQFCSSSLEKIQEWVEELKNWPVVLKPINSAGGDKVKICYDSTDITQGFHNIVKKEPNMLGIIDEEVLVQEYVEAPELAINTVQYDGKPYLCEIFQFHKLLLKGGKKIYDYASLLSTGDIDQASIDYAFKVAKLLDIKYGPMHAEIFVTDKGPVLIEAAARLMGANIPTKLMTECLSHPQIYMTTLIYSRPNEFHKYISKNSVIKKHLRIIFLISTTTGKFSRINHLEVIQNLKSFYDMKIRITNMIYITQDYDTSPGLIYLCHEDVAIIENDYQIIRSLEKDNMYEVC